MDKGEIALAATMGLGTVQGFSTVLGSVVTADMVSEEDYTRGLGLAFGWTFLAAVGLCGFSDSYAPLIAWIIMGGAMMAAYEFHRDKTVRGLDA